MACPSNEFLKLILRNFKINMRRYMFYWKYACCLATTRSLHSFIVSACVFHVLVAFNGFMRAAILFVIISLAYLIGFTLFIQRYLQQKYTIFNLLRYMFYVV